MVHYIFKTTSLLLLSVPRRGSYRRMVVTPRRRLRMSDADKLKLMFSCAGDIVGFPASNAPVNISSSDDVMVSFSRDGGNSRFNGIIDKKRKTVDGVNMSLDTNTPDFGYTMKCK